MHIKPCYSLLLHLLTGSDASRSFHMNSDFEVPGDREITIHFAARLVKFIFCSIAYFMILRDCAYRHISLIWYYFIVSSTCILRSTETVTRRKQSAYTHVHFWKQSSSGWRYVPVELNLNALSVLYCMVLGPVDQYAWFSSFSVLQHRYCDFAAHDASEIYPYQAFPPLPFGYVW